MSVLPASEVSRPRVIFSIEGVGEAVGEFHRFSSPRTADAILRRLPVGGRIVRYGEEVYFQVDVKAPAENPRSRVEVGGIAYWPLSNAICIFYGPTKPYGAVNKLGMILQNLDLFSKVKEGTIVTIRKG